MTPLTSCYTSGIVYSYTKALANVVRPSGTSEQFAIRLNGIRLCTGLNYASFYALLFSVMLLVEAYLLFQKLC